MKGIIFLTCFVLTAHVYATKNSDTTLLSSTEQSNLEMTIKYRGVLLKNLIDTDFVTANKTEKILRTYQNSAFTVLYPYETWMLLLINKKYNALADSLKNIDTASISALEHNRFYIHDDLGKQLESMIRSQSDFLKLDIQISQQLTKEDTDVLILFIRDILHEYSKNHRRQDAIQSFKNKYQISQYDLFIQNYMRYERNPLKTDMELEFGAGNAIFSNTASNLLTNGLFFDIATITDINNFRINERFGFIFSNLKSDVSNSVSKGTSVSLINIELSLGYTLPIFRNFDILPYAGLSVLSFSLPNKNTQDNKKTSSSMYYSISPLAGVDFEYIFLKSSHYDSFMNRTRGGSSVCLRYFVEPVSFSGLPENGRSLFHSIGLTIKFSRSGLERLMK